MDSIKKKMRTLAAESKAAEERTAGFEEEILETNSQAEASEEMIRTIQKKMQSMEGQYDDNSETFFDATIKLEAKEKAYSTAAAEAASLNRRLWLLEEEVSKSEEKMAKAVYTLTKECKRADLAVRTRQDLENRNTANEGESDELETKLKEAKAMLEDSEMKYEDIFRKLRTLETELNLANERAGAVENKIIQLEEELRVVGQNLQTLEVSEEKSKKREDSHQKNILDLRSRLQTAVQREENATMNIGRLNIKIDRNEESLLGEKLKIKKVSDDLAGVFDSMMSHGN